MKTFIAFLLSVSVMLFCSASLDAQGNGQSQGHVPDQAKIGSPNQPGHSGHPEAKPEWETKFNERFQNDSAFQSRIKTLLPAGTDLKTAEDGFKNRGLFIAALHVSKNLNIPFDQLKTKMTGPMPESLGNAIHELRPALSQDQAKDEAKKAEKEAALTEKTSPTS